MNNKRSETYSLSFPISEYDSIPIEKLRKEFTSFIESVENMVAEIKEMHSTYSNFRVEMRVEPYSDSDKLYPYLVADRPLTSQELAEAEERERRRQDFKRQQYEALKKEFESKQ